ncbi:MAG: hypothetical protein ACYC6B_01730 [Thermoleophilia bacterium]
MKTPLRRFVLVALGTPLLAFGLVILLGAIVRFVTDSFTLSLSTYLAAIVFGGVLPTAGGFFLWAS